jgi:hypothetical protein
MDETGISTAFTSQGKAQILVARDRAIEAKYQA